MIKYFSFLRIEKNETQFTRTTKTIYLSTENIQCTAYVSVQWNSKSATFRIVVTSVEKNNKFQSRTGVEGTEALVGVQLCPFFNLGATWRWVVKATYRPLYPSKENLYPLYGRLGGPQDRSELVRKTSSPSVFDPRTAQPVDSHHTDWTIPPHNINKIGCFKPICTRDIPEDWHVQYISNVVENVSLQ